MPRPGPEPGTNPDYVEAALPALKILCPGLDSNQEPTPTMSGLLYLLKNTVPRPGLEPGTNPDYVGAALPA